MELKDANIFPCRKFGMNEHGVIEPIDYEVVGIVDGKILRRGLPLQGPSQFDGYWRDGDYFDAIGILDSYTIDLIIDNWIREKVDERDACIKQLLRCTDWASDTFITKDAKERLEELKKEIDM